MKTRIIRLSMLVPVLVYILNLIISPILQWIHPADVLKECSGGLLAIAPPQTYELSRLIQFESVDELLNFAWKRSSHRVKRWMPVIYSCSGGTIFALPGS